MNVKAFLDVAPCSHVQVSQLCTTSTMETVRPCTGSISQKAVTIEYRIFDSRFVSICVSKKSK
jgi:hypothetical protein